MAEVRVRGRDEVGEEREEKSKGVCVRGSDQVGEEREEKM